MGVDWYPLLRSRMEWHCTSVTRLTGVDTPSVKQGRMGDNEILREIRWHKVKKKYSVKRTADNSVT